MIVVSGRLQIRKWTDNNGNNRTTAEIVAEELYFGESKKEKSNAASNPTFDYNFAPLPAGFNRRCEPLQPYDYDDDDAQLPF